MTEYAAFLGGDAPGACGSVGIFNQENRLLLFNVPEGLQRFSSEGKVRLTKIERIFLTRFTSDSVMGLPGLTFTINDGGCDSLNATCPDQAFVQFWNSVKKNFFTYRKMHFGIQNLIPAAPVENTSTRSSFHVAASFPVTHLGPLSVYPIYAGGKEGSSSSSSCSKTPVFSYLVLIGSATTFSMDLAMKKGVKPGKKIGLLKKGESVESDERPGEMVSPKEVMVEGSLCGTLVLDFSEDELLLEKQDENTFSASFKNSLQRAVDDHLGVRNQQQQQGAHQGAENSGEKKTTAGKHWASVVHTIMHVGPDQLLSQPQYMDYVTCRLLGVKDGDTLSTTDGGEKKKPTSHRFSPNRSTTTSDLLKKNLTGNPTTSFSPTRNFAPSLSSAHMHRLHLHLCDNSLFPLPLHSSLTERGDAKNRESPNRWPFAFKCPLRKPHVLEEVEGMNCLDLETCKGMLSPSFLTFLEEEASIAGNQPLFGTRASIAMKATEKQQQHQQLAIVDDENSNYHLPGSSTEAEQIFETLKNKVLFLGTGSAVPSKYRNVSSFLCFPEQNGDPLALCDCGEGTLSQLRSFFGGSKVAEEEILPEVIRRVGLVFISHNHADHHLGLFSLLQYRKLHYNAKSPSSSGVTQTPPPLLIVCPKEFYVFGVDMCRSFSLSYICGLSGKLVDFDDAAPTVMPPIRFTICKDASSTPFSGRSAGGSYPGYGTTAAPALGATPPYEACINAVARLGPWKLETFEVDHPASAQAGILTHEPSGKRVVYSGDTRPHAGLIALSRGADILVHECTFADELQVEAQKKKHSTFAEARAVAAQAGVKSLLLTHFSQRYPKGPGGGGAGKNGAVGGATTQTSLTNDKSGEEKEIPYCFAFDFMMVDLSGEGVAQAASKMPVFFSLVSEYESWTQRTFKRLRDFDDAQEADTTAPKRDLRKEEEERTIAAKKRK